VQDVIQEAPSAIARVKAPKPVRDALGEAIREWQTRSRDRLAAAAQEIGTR
jgi:hypothetical protein